MNANPRPTPELSRELDLLVDGELDETRRRQLLQSLEQTPELWRHCALAFLAAQSWRREMRVLAGESKLAGQPTPAREPQRGQASAQPTVAATKQTPATVPPAPKANHWTGMMAVAASFFVAFTLGILLRGEWGQNDVPRDGNIAHGDGKTARGDAKAALPERRSRQFAVEPRRHQATESPASNRENVTLVVNDGQGGKRRVNVPLVDDSQLGAIPWNSEPVMPVEIQRQLEQAGHHVQRQRRYAPFQLDDGRQVVVPVEDVQITPVGRKMY